MSCLEIVFNLKIFKNKKMKASLIIRKHKTIFLLLKIKNLGPRLTIPLKFVFKKPFLS